MLQLFPRLLEWHTPCDTSVIAEGVENYEQLTLLRELGCDQVQGYFISRPKPKEDANALLREQATQTKQLNTANNLH